MAHTHKIQTKKDVVISRFGKCDAARFIAFTSIFWIKNHFLKSILKMATKLIKEIIIIKKRDLRKIY